MREEAIISDLDGTLAFLNGRDPYKEQYSLSNDTINSELARILKMYRELEFKIIFVTGRWEEYYTITQQWLRNFGIEFDELYMRPIAMYDSGTRLKEWYLENIIFQRYQPILAFEDVYTTAKMYRNHGVPCWQVNSEPWDKIV